MKPICVPCQRFYRPSHNGVAFVEGMPKHNGASPGTAEPESWRPYKLWMGDEWTCRGCGAVIIVGTGQRPIAEHYEPEFAGKMKSYKPITQVNDC